MVIYIRFTQYSVQVSHFDVRMNVRPIHHAESEREHRPLPPRTFEPRNHIYRRSMWSLIPGVKVPRIRGINIQPRNPIQSHFVDAFIRSEVRRIALKHNSQRGFTKFDMTQRDHSSTSSPYPRTSSCMRSCNPSSRSICRLILKSS